MPSVRSRCRESRQLNRQDSEISTHDPTRTPVEPDDPPIAQLAVAEIEAEIDVEGSIRSGKLAGKSMWSAIWILALPVLLQQMMTACVGLVDTLLAGRLPKEIVLPALDAIGIGSYLNWFIGIAMAGLGIGGQALISRSVGAGDSFTSHRALGQAMVLSFLWGVVVAVLLWFGVYPLAWWCKLSPDASALLVEYVHVTCYGMPLAGLMMVGSMCLHGAGETTLPALIAVAVNIVNIFASWIFSGVDIPMGETVLMNPFSLDWHVAGIAAGTSLSFFIGAALTMWIVLRGVKDLKLRASDAKPDLAMSGRIIRVGLPGFLESLSMWSVNFFVLNFIGQIARADPKLSEGLQGAHVIAIRWESFSFLPGFAMGIAAGALAGQFLGAGSPRLARKAIIACTAVGAIIMGLLGVVFMAFGEPLTTLISDEPIHVQEAPPLLFICGMVQVFFAITLVTRQGLRGVGDTRWTFVITTLSSYGVRLPLAWLLGMHFEMGLTGVWIGLCGEIVLRSILFTGRFLHGGWTRIAV